MTIRSVTGNIKDLAGVSIPNATFSLLPETYAFGTTSSEAIFGDQVTVLSDSSGDVAFDLHEGKYIGRISTTQGPKTFRLVVDSEGPWTLGRLIDASIGEITPSLIQQAQDAAQSAIDAAGSLTLGIGNAIINGNFAINQRAVSGTVTLAVGAYGHDRWKAGASGCTYTFATSANVTTLTITAGSLVQVIEGASLFTGTYVLSFNGTAQGKIGSGVFSASGVTGSVTGGTNLAVEFNTGTVAQVQLDAGSVATPFERRPVGTELALCQRYFEKTFNDSVAPASNAGNQGAISTTSGAALSNASLTNWHFKVTKRATPAISTFNPSAAGSDWRNDNDGTNVAALAVAIGTSAVSITIAGAPATQRIHHIHAVADAEL